LMRLTALASPAPPALPLLFAVHTRPVPSMAIPRGPPLVATAKLLAVPVVVNLVTVLPVNGNVVLMFATQAFPVGSTAINCGFFREASVKPVPEKAPVVAFSLLTLPVPVPPLLFTTQTLLDPSTAIPSGPFTPPAAPS